MSFKPLGTVDHSYRSLSGQDFYVGMVAYKDLSKLKDRSIKIDDYLFKIVESVKYATIHHLQLCHIPETSLKEGSLVEILSSSRVRSVKFKNKTYEF
jgi:hypothetical protein